MRNSVAILDQVSEEALRHVLRTDGQEDLTFALWTPSSGASRRTAVVRALLLPQEGDRLVHGNASILPRYLERAVLEAQRLGLGLALMHSHHWPGWQGMSDDDYLTEQAIALRAVATTRLPLVGMTAGSDGSWSARFWEKTGPKRYEMDWCESVRVVGEKLSLTYNDDLIPPPEIGEELLRTVSAWGEARQRALTRIHVCVVGCGSVGMMVAAALARMGIRRITLLDFDRVKKHNLDRLLFAFPEDAEHQELKVDVLARYLKRASTVSDFEVAALPYSVCEKEGYQAALDCDVVFSCVDRPWARSTLNQIAYAHVIPVIDGGLHIAAREQGGLRHADWSAQTASPGRQCLECIKQYDPGLVSMERDGYLDDPEYIKGLPKDHPLRRNENVVAFSMSCASMQVLQLVALTVAPSYTDPGAQRYRFVTSELSSTHDACLPNCPYAKGVGLGDQFPSIPWGKHAAAEKSRAKTDDESTLGFKSFL